MLAISFSNAETKQMIEFIDDGVRPHEMGDLMVEKGFSCRSASSYRAKAHLENHPFSNPNSPFSPEEVDQMVEFIGKGVRPKQMADHMHKKGFKRRGWDAYSAKARKIGHPFPDIRDIYTPEEIEQMIRFIDNGVRSCEMGDYMVRCKFPRRSTQSYYAKANYLKHPFPSLRSPFSPEEIEQMVRFIDMGIRSRKMSEYMASKGFPKRHWESYSRKARQVNHRFPDIRKRITPAEIAKVKELIDAKHSYSAIGRMLPSYGFPLRQPRVISRIAVDKLGEAPRINPIEPKESNEIERLFLTGMTFKAMVEELVRLGYPRRHFATLRYHAFVKGLVRRGPHGG